MREHILVKISELPQEVDTVLVAMGFCGGSWQDVCCDKRLVIPRVDHGQMLYYADGYVTAWFMWLLQGDIEAAKAFSGDAPELLSNALYQDQQIDIH